METQWATPTVSCNKWYHHVCFKSRISQSEGIGFYFFHNIPGWFWLKIRKVYLISYPSVIPCPKKWQSASCWKHPMATLNYGMFGLQNKPSVRTKSLLLCLRMLNILNTLCSTWSNWKYLSLIILPQERPIRWKRIICLRIHHLIRTITRPLICPSIWEFKIQILFNIPWSATSRWMKENLGHNRELKEDLSKKTWRSQQHGKRWIRSTSRPELEQKIALRRR